MKKNKTMRLASCLLAVTLLTTCVISGTFAKYTSSAKGDDSAVVAAWSIEVNDNQIAQVDGSETKVSFDLFDTINEADTTTAESDVASGDIAPGTGGSFALKVENFSDVNAKYTIALTEVNNSNIPIQYSLDGSTWKDDLGDINTSLKDVAIAMTLGSETKTIYWRWCYEGTESGAHANQTDIADTALGITAAQAAGTYPVTTGTVDAPSVGISAAITVTQVD